MVTLLLWDDAGHTPADGCSRVGAPQFVWREWGHCRSFEPVPGGRRGWEIADLHVWGILDCELVIAIAIGIVRAGDKLLLVSTACSSLVVRVRAPKNQFLLAINDNRTFAHLRASYFLLPPSIRHHLCIEHWTSSDYCSESATKVTLSDPISITHIIKPSQSGSEIRTDVLVASQCFPSKWASQWFGFRCRQSDATEWTGVPKEVIYEKQGRTADSGTFFRCWSHQRSTSVILSGYGYVVIMRSLSPRRAIWNSRLNFETKGIGYWRGLGLE
jgi:hypothetical protein